MSNLKFEGNLDGINARQLEYISSVLEERGFKTGKVLIQVVGKAGDNYAANVKRIIAEKDGETFQMIAKVAISIEAMRAMMHTEVIFHNEHVMYTKVLPKFSELEEAAEIPKSERLRYAACYGSLSETPNEIILLEDLQVSNFVMLDRFISLTDKIVKTVLKSFAALHSLSYALKKQEPETYAHFRTELINFWNAMEKSEEMNMFAQQIENDIMALLEYKYQKVLKGKVTQVFTQLNKMSQIDSKSKYAIIQQGDSWTNNIMFRLEEGQPTQCCMIDYQLSKECSPAADIHYMIFNCTDHDTRSKYYHEWIDYYHSELDNRLANFGLKANYVYPKDQLDADLRRYGKLSLGQAAMNASILMRDSTDAEKFKDAMETLDVETMINSNKMSNLNKDTIMRFKNRLEGLVISFQHLGYL